MKMKKVSLFFLGFIFLGQFVNAQTNIALGKTVKTSSDESAKNVKTNAVDGKTTTRWASTSADPQWISVDLAGGYLISSIKITWSDTYAKDYKIQISTDGQDWEDIKSITGNTQLVNTLPNISRYAKQVRIYCTKKAVQTGYSISEIEVNGLKKSIGIVKWFNPEKGMGMISLDGPNGKEVYVHFMSIDENGMKALDEGQWVVFDLANGPKGLEAKHVNRI